MIRTCRFTQRLQENIIIHLNILGKNKFSNSEIGGEKIKYDIKALRKQVKAENKYETKNILNVITQSAICNIEVLYLF